MGTSELMHVHGADGKMCRQMLGMHCAYKVCMHAHAGKSKNKDVEHQDIDCMCRACLHTINKRMLCEINTEVDNDVRLGLACLKESESVQAIESSSTCSWLRATLPTRQCGWVLGAVFPATVTTEAHSPPAEAAD